MPHWLLKTEPNDYAWEDLVRDKKTVWDGVSNALALKHIRAMKKGDAALIYHTGTQRAAVGIAGVTTEPYIDPRYNDPKLVVFGLKATKKLGRPVTLGEMKADKVFAGWDLLRIGRLSVVPVPAPVWNRILELAEDES